MIFGFGSAWPLGFACDSLFGGLKFSNNANKHEYLVSVWFDLVRLDSSLVLH